VASVALFVLIGMLAGAAWGVWRLRRGRPPGTPSPDRGSGLPAAAGDYLDTLDRSLELPAEVRAEIREELADHLVDSIESIETEGLDRERATREALARLGRPEDLARQLRRAHQTTRRLLAGAAGGVFQTGFGFLGGLFIGTWLVLLGLLAGSLLVNGLLKLPIDLLAAYLPRFTTDSKDLVANSAEVALAACVAAAIAARQGVRAFCQYSQRTLRSVARWWALAGALVLAWLVLFVVTADQSWLTVVIELAIPVCFAAGALLKVGSRWTLALGRMVLVGLLATLVSGLLLAAGPAVSGSDGQGGAWNIDPLVREFDRVAPAWTANQPEYQFGGAGGCCDSMVSPAVEIDAAYLAQFHGIRFEVWRAVPWSGAPDWAGQYTIDPGSDGPYATAAADISGDVLRAEIDLRHVRTARWLVFLTGVGPDGTRYRLLPIGDQAQSVFSGTVWDWLTAGN
jgi:hypothetical protein